MAAQHVLTELVKAEAFPGSGRAGLVGATCFEPSATQELRDLGAIHQPAADAWFVTEEAMNMLDMTIVCVQPVSMFEPREIALHGMTEHELLVIMSRNGWSWQRLTKNTAPYTNGGPLVWATSGWSPARSVFKEYLLVLLTWSDLCEQFPALDRVPHGCNRSVYADMLAGTPAPAPLELGLPMMDIDSKAMCDVPVAGDKDSVVAESDEPDSPLPEAGSSSDDADFHGAEDAVAVASPPDIDIAEALAGVMAPAIVPVPPAVAEEAARDPAYLDDNHDWGCFRITLRRDPPAWTARCPFHSASTATKCKKRIAFPADSDEEKVRALHQLYAWCNAARDFDRKWRHALLDPRSIAPPVLQVLKAQCITEPPMEPPAADDELDSARVPRRARQRAAPRPPASSRGRGRGRGQRGGRGRAASSAARAAAAADSGDPEPVVRVSSDGTSSSSSSSSANSSSNSSS